MRQVNGFKDLTQSVPEAASLRSTTHVEYLHSTDLPQHSPSSTMSLINLFNDSFFSEFDRMFDEAFDRHGGSQVQRQSTNNAPRVLRPR